MTSFSTTGSAPGLRPITMRRSSETALDREQRTKVQGQPIKAHSHTGLENHVPSLRRHAIHCLRLNESATEHNLVARTHDLSHDCFLSD
jgi:hypothetical protein